MSIKQALIPNEFIRWHFISLSDNPTLAEKLMGQLSIAPSVLSESGRTLTADQYASLINRTIAYADDESFGCLNRPIRRGSFQMMAYACVNCSTLEQVIQRCFEFYGLMNDQIQWQLVKSGDKAELRFNFTELHKPQSAYFLAFITTVIWRWLNWMLDKHIELDAAEFIFPAAEFSLDKVFLTPVSYKQKMTRLIINADYLQLQVKQTSNSLDEFLEHIPGCLMSHYQEDLSLKRRLKEYLDAQEDIHGVTLSAAAEHFCCSEKSLIRGLNAEGTRFKLVADNIKKQRAEYMLVKTHLTNQQIAAQLGYSDPSVFYRCIKKWFGKTPNELRIKRGR